MAEPGPFGWVSRLLRWQDGDIRQGGQGGPLPPPKADVYDPTEHDIYQGLADGWLHGTVGAALSSFFSEPRTRKELYVLFEKMDMTDEVGSVLDLYAEDVTTVDNESHRAVWIEGKSEPIVGACMDMLDQLRFEEEVTALARDLAKFGDVFERTVYRTGPDGGVRRLLPTAPLTMTRKEDKEGKLEGFLQVGKTFRNNRSEVSYPWDFAHFRLRGRDRRYPYGTSILQNAIRPWKQWIVLSDWMLGYQCQRHPDRNLVMLDIGSGSEVEAAGIANRFRAKLKRSIILDPAGTTNRGAMGQNFESHSPLEDIVLPIRPESKTRIEKLAGSANAIDIAPLQLTLDRLYAALRVPKSWNGIEFVQGMPLNMKASLTNQDIRYARTVARIQKSMIAGVRYLCELNLMLRSGPAATGAPETGLTSALDWRAPGADFRVRMTKTSYLAEMEKLEVEQLRQQVALSMLELGSNNPAVNMLVWTEYILRDVVKVPEDLLQELIQDIQPERADAMRFGDPVSAGLTKEDVAAAKKGTTATAADKKQIAEALRSNPKLRESVNRAARLMRPDGDEMSESFDNKAILPDRDNELFKNGLLADVLTEADVTAMLAEAAR